MGWKTEDVLYRVDVLPGVVEGAHRAPRLDVVLVEEVLPPVHIDAT
ncbi:MAG: hypothetical protein M3O70_06645 [Actinomycetota bacterium]|nr:hypothetical protein [Actinomycetota bacterium]